MNPNDFSKILNQLSDEEITSFLEGLSSAQSGMYNQVLALVKSLDLSAGAIKSNTENLRILKSVRIQLEKVILTDSYKKKVDKYVNAFPKVKSVNDDYFLSVVKEFNSNKHTYKNLITTSIELTKNSLLEAGINDNVINPTKQIIVDAITGNWTFEDLVDNLRTTIKGNEEIKGSLERYGSQIATDALNQFSANYNRSVSEDLGMEWYYYSGSSRRTSRPFCKKFAGKYFHKKEVEDFGKGIDINGGRLSSRERQGRIRGTNSSNIFTYRGGYNCKHQYIPTTVSFVPKSTVERNIEKGYFSTGEPKPEKESAKQIKQQKPISYAKSKDQVKEYFESKGKQAKERIDDYTTFSNKYNFPLRNPNDPRFKPGLKKYAKDVKELSNVLKEAPKFEGSSYRGMGLYADEANAFNAQLKKGNIFSDKGFMSTSAKKEAATNFAKGYDFEYVFKINGKNGVSLGDVARIKEEEEILFNLDSKFSIKNVVKKGNRFEIELDEI